MGLQNTAEFKELKDMFSYKSHMYIDQVFSKRDRYSHATNTSNLIVFSFTMPWVFFSLEVEIELTVHT
jgi:hypothetical protein